MPVEEHMQNNVVAMLLMTTVMMLLAMVLVNMMLMFSRQFEDVCGSCASAGGVVAASLILSVRSPCPAPLNRKMNAL